MQSGQAGADMMRRHQPARAAARARDVRRLDRSHRRPAKCRRRRRGRRASSATSSSPSGTGPIRRRTCTTRSRPIAAIRRVNANGLIYGSLELSADYLPVLDPVRNTDQPGAADRARSEHAADVADDAAAVAVLGRRADLDEQEQRPQPDVRRAGAASGSRPPCGRPTNPDFCKAGSTIRRRSCSRSQRSGRQLAMYDPKTKKLTHISTCFSTHHLMFAEDANHTLWTSGGGQVVGWLNTKMFDETQRRREVAGLDGAHPRHQRQRQARRVRRARTSRSIPTKDKRIGGALLRRRAGARRLGLGIGARLPGRGRPADARRESARDGARRSLRAAVRQSEGAGAGLLAARHGRRSQRRRLGGARERPHGELRSPQVQGPAERPDGDRASIAPRAGRSTPSRCRS